MAGSNIGMTRSLTNSGGYRNLVEFRAGRVTMTGKMLNLEPENGFLYVYQDDVGFIHFCWKNCSTNIVEEKIIIFTKSFEFKRVNQSKTERVYQLEFKWTSERFFYWIQEPNMEEDYEWCHRINEIIKNPPTNFLTAWYRLIPRGEIKLNVVLDLTIQRFEAQGRARLLHELFLKRLPRKKHPESFMEYPGRGPLDGNRESLTTCAIDSSSSTALATAGLPSNFPQAPERVVDDGKAPMNFNDLFDDVIDMILYKLDLCDLASISDTTNRLRNIAASVFCRKYGDHVIGFDAFSYSYHTYAFKMQEFRNWKHKPLIRISIANIWFKVLRNFGKNIKIICTLSSHDRSNIYQMKIPYAMWNLTKYVLAYCAASLEVLDLYNYPFFKLTEPLPKLHTFIAECGFPNGGNASWKHWNANALELMPNLRSLRLWSVPIAIEKHFPKLERIRLELKTDEDVQSLICFLHLNPQITYLDLFCRAMVHNHADRIYASIEENLTQLKTLKIFHDDADSEMVLIRTYHFKSVSSFSYRNADLDSGRQWFAFNDLQKIEILTLNPDWVHFIRNLKKLEIFKMDMFCIRGFEDCLQDVYMRQLVESSELEQIIVKGITEDDNVILKETLGSEWEEIAIPKECRYPLLPFMFKVKYQRISKKKTKK